MKIAKLGIVGAGQMGNGIAVVMRDLTDAFVQKGLDTVAKNLKRGVDKGKKSGRGFYDDSEGRAGAPA